MSGFSRRILRLAASRCIFVTYLCGMILSSALPMSDAPDTPMFWSKINPSLQNLLHIPMFFGFAVLLYQVGGDTRWGRRGRFGKVLAASVLMGILLESIQIFVPGRYAGASDMVLNIIGAVLGAVFCFVMGRRGAGRV